MKPTIESKETLGIIPACGSCGGDKSEEGGNCTCKITKDDTVCMRCGGEGEVIIGSDGKEYRVLDYDRTDGERLTCPDCG